jgi:EAL domain-containing protein (putative c-di-GMP-specific phosphodiesterase class I)
VLQQACLEAVRWPAPIRVAVNLSPRQLTHGSLAGRVMQALAASGLAPNRLELEITEAMMMEASEQNIETLQQIRALGVRVAMDDFGTGYSSLGHLRDFRFDKIKLDRSFVMGLDGSDSSDAIVQAVADLGMRLGITTTVEGVETLAQLNRVQTQGIEEVQGFLISRSLTPEDALTFIESKVLP